MAKKKVIYNMKGLEELKKQLVPWSNKLSLSIAKTAPKKIVANIKKRKTGIFELDNLPDNEDSTKKAKGHSRVLVGKGKLLTSISKWVIGREGNKYAIMPPAGRRDVVGYLQEGIKLKIGVLKKYPILDMPEKYLPRWVKDMVNNAFNKFMKQYA